MDGLNTVSQDKGARDDRSFFPFGVSDPAPALGILLAIAATGAIGCVASPSTPDGSGGANASGGSNGTGGGANTGGSTGSGGWNLRWLGRQCGQRWRERRDGWLDGLGRLGHRLGGLHVGVGRLGLGQRRYDQRNGWRHGLRWRGRQRKWWSQRGRWRHWDRDRWNRRRRGRDGWQHGRGRLLDPEAVRRLRSRFPQLDLEIADGHGFTLASQPTRRTVASSRFTSRPRPPEQRVHFDDEDLPRPAISGAAPGCVSSGGGRPPDVHLRCLQRGSASLVEPPWQ